ncbi:unnamed protein product, partial [Hapterophycus canaliculatus]
NVHVCFGWEIVCCVINILLSALLPAAYCASEVSREVGLTGREDAVREVVSESGERFSRFVQCISHPLESEHVRKLDCYYCLQGGSERCNKMKAKPCGLIFRR